MSTEGVLTPEQIAALIEQAKEGTAPAPAAPVRVRRPPRVREIDFSRPKKFSQEQQRRLERAHEAFCRAASTRLTAELRLSVELEVINIDQLTWSSAVSDIPPSSLYAVVGTSPLDTKVLLSAEQGLIMRLVELLLGGSVDAKPTQRDLTEIEVALSTKMMSTFVDQLSQTWDELFGLKLSLLALESSLAQVQLAPVSEPCLALTMETKLDKWSATMSLTIPHPSIESVVGRLVTGQFGDEDEGGHDTSAMAGALRDVEIELRAEVAAVDLSVDEVLSIRPGDVIGLGVPAEAGITVFADRAPSHRARPGKSGKWRAIQILERLEHA